MAVVDEAQPKYVGRNGRAYERERHPEKTLEIMDNRQSGEEDIQNISAYSFVEVET